MATNYDAEIYDIVYAAMGAEDVHWYRKLAGEAGGPVLELGAGTGRTALPIARDGAEIDCLDLDEGMLSRLDARLAEEPEDVRCRVRTFSGDMRDFNMDREYALIQIPFRAFLHNITRDDQLACLRCCYRHLRPDGVLAFNIFHPSLSYMAGNRGLLEGVWRWRTEHDHPDGGVIIQSDASKYDTVNQVMSVKLRYEHFDQAGMLLKTYLMHLKLAYLYEGEVRFLLQQAGFTDVIIDGSFAGGPLENEGGELVVRARRGSA